MEFNINRLMRLVKRDAIVYRKPVLLGAAAVFIVLVLMMLHYAYDDGMIPEIFLAARFNFFLLVGGLLLTSIIFWEFKSPAGRVQFLGMPSSTLEKFSSRWIYTMLVFPIFCLLLFALVFAVSSLFIDYKGNTEIFELVSDGFVAYWIAHPIILMFGVWYNRYVAPKSILSVLLFMFAIVIIFFVLHRMMFHEMYDGLKISENITVDPDPNFQIRVEGMMETVAKTLGLLIMPLFFTVVGYFKLKEKQA